MKDIQTERISEIILKILQVLGGEVFSKTQLVKLIYLIDVIQSRKGEGNFSGVRYKRYYYGPYSKDIEEALSKLEREEQVRIIKKKNFEGDPYYHIKLNPPVAFNILERDDRKTIEDRMKNLKTLELKKLLDITYNTKEFEEADFGEEITL